ncbi:hypothetical protein [Oribacterium sp. FC2011]|uniref:hypothetical protein n=1 Tax=Oribacterium sp. FC2011 TaxID=1408311 RepID=UPI0004E0D4C1|nr:hypothetical protein [Oribacterium sp. FC2011]
MKLLNRVFSFLLISCALAFLFYLLSAENFSADIAFVRPSYYQAESSTNYFPVGGVAAFIGIVSCLFAWFKVRHKDGLDKEELYEQTLRQKTITNDITSTLGEQQAATSKYMETVGDNSEISLQSNETGAVYDDDETVALNNESDDITVAVNDEHDDETVPVNDDPTVAVNDESDDLTVPADSEIGNKEEVL